MSRANLPVAVTLLPNLSESRTAFRQLSKRLGIHEPRKEIADLVIYEMTDGMRTSTEIGGAEAYVDGGRFVLRLMHLLRDLGSTACYVNVVEERHRKRENYGTILSGLRRLYPEYQEYAEAHKTRFQFLGDLGSRIEARGQRGDFARELRGLEKETARHSAFRAYFLINYSLDWAMAHPRRFSGAPPISEIVRHTKFQVPTGMQLPPSVSDYSSIVFVQQGSSSSTWTDRQLCGLLAVCLRSRMLNRGTQFLKKYGDAEQAQVRREREVHGYFRHRNLGQGTSALATAAAAASAAPKRVVIGGPYGPEVYEV